VQGTKRAEYVGHGKYSTGSEYFWDVVQDIDPVCDQIKKACKQLLSVLLATSKEIYM
jgi:hypothetical protein